MAELIVTTTPTDFSWLNDHWAGGIKRIFYLYNVPESATRGLHRHGTCRMALTCQSGSVQVYIQTPEQDQFFRLDSPRQTLLVAPTDWRVMYNFSPDANLLVFADQYFCDTTYIDTAYRTPNIRLRRFGASEGPQIPNENHREEYVSYYSQQAHGQ